MTIAVVFLLVGILVRISSLEVEVGEEGSVVMGKGLTDNLFGCRALVHYVPIV